MFVGLWHACSNSWSDGGWRDPFTGDRQCRVADDADPAAHDESGNTPVNTAAAYRHAHWPGQGDKRFQAPGGWLEVPSCQQTQTSE